MIVRAGHPHAFEEMSLVLCSFCLLKLVLLYGVHGVPPHTGLSLDFALGSK